MTSPIGKMTESLALQSSAPVAVAVSSITRAGGTATATTDADHGFLSNDRVTIAGADQAAYNGAVTVTVTGARSFTYPVTGTPATPATGSITALYVSDAARGAREIWQTYATVWAEEIPQRTSERLQAGTMVGESFRQYRIYFREDVAPKHRAILNATRTLEIRGVSHVGRQWTLLDCSEVVG